MKKVIIQILKALAYFAVYFVTSNVVTFIAGFILSFIRATQDSAAGLSREEGLAAFTAELNSYTGICLAISAVLTLLIYFIIEKVKKSSLAKETDMKKVSGKQMALTVVGALGGMIFLNFILSILPIPKELMGDLSTGMGKLTSYPFWQAILANCLLVPVIEEVVFRGYIFSRLEKAMPSVVAAIISSLAFGIVHGGVLWAIWAFVLGMLICVVRIKSGSIIPGMIFHIIMNTFAMVVSYYPVLSGMTETVMYILTAVGGILVAVYVAGILMDKSDLEKSKTDVRISSVNS